jgi:hypothetical protein
MRLQSFIAATIFSLLIPPTLEAASKTYNDCIVEKLEGTIMVQRNDNTKPFALETGSTVQKGDTLTVYEKSWVILKTHKGDSIGIDGGTVVTIDEYYIEGPDRQIRLILNKGFLLLRTNGCGSRQSFFEINTGSVVSSINDTHSTLSYEPAKEHLRVQYFEGKLTVIDKDNEQKFKDMHTEHNWNSGKMSEEEGIPVDEVDVVNFNRFFNAEPRLAPTDNNMLLRGNE